METDTPDVIQVTDDGSDTVFNGVPDWVYEEEASRNEGSRQSERATDLLIFQVFSNNYALWWSPESDSIAYLRSDETEVKDYTLQYYNPSGAAFDPEPYPENFVMK